MSPRNDYYVVPMYKAVNMAVSSSDKPDVDLVSVVVMTNTSIRVQLGSWPG